ncbi:MAG: hypothetical protein NXI12_14355 [Alphaproteobacteria bacterium]|nr:hypothetical protein [Alphaproteobacteria bacterium]
MRILSFLVAGAALVLAGGSAHAQSSRYAQVDSDGVGNCIFSNQELSYQQEGSAAYRNNKTEFSNGENVHVRCYFAQPLGQYRSNGRLSNSLRDGRGYFVDFELRDPARPGSMGPDIVSGQHYDYDSSDASMTQQRFDIGDMADCDFRLPESENRRWGNSASRCTDLNHFTRRVAEEAGASLPFTATYCVRVFMQFADVIDERREFDSNTGSWRTSRAPRIMDHRIAESCFDYTVR